MTSETDDVVEFMIFQETEPNKFSMIASISGTLNECVHEGVAEGEYKYKVVAVDNSGNSSDGVPGCYPDGNVTVTHVATDAYELMKPTIRFNPSA